MTKRKLQYWVIPPDADPEFIASMENILDTYEEPYDPDYPKLCMDEQPVQLHKEIRKPIAATKNHARRIDYEYERCGTACVFMFSEPLSGWRQATVRPQRTKVDWALEMAALLDTRYKQARKVILVCDNLNTHTAGAFPEPHDALVTHTNADLPSSRTSVQLELPGAKPTSPGNETGWPSHQDLIVLRGRGMQGDTGPVSESREPTSAFMP